MPVLLALAAAVCWGTADFLGGVGSRRGGRVNALTLGAQTTGLITFIPVALLVGGTLTVADFWWSLGAGMSAGTAVFFLYIGFTKSHTGVVAPTAAILTAGVPVAFGVATGERLNWAQTVGIIAGLAAIWLISRSGRGASEYDANTPLGIVYGLGAGLGFALMFIFLDQLSDGSAALAVLPLRLGGVVAMLAVSAVRRLPIVPRREVWWLVVWSGFVGSVGNLAFIVATGLGQLSIVAVVGSLFPAATVTLAYLFMGERLRPLQRIGVVAALGAVALVSTG